MDRFTIREQIVERFRQCASDVSKADSLKDAFSILDKISNSFAPLDTMGYYKKNFILPLYKMTSISEIVSVVNAKADEIEKNGSYYEKMFF